MNMRSVLDISAYLVVGPENTKGRQVKDIVKAALDGGFTCVQLRSKVASAREMISLCKETAQVIAESGKSDSVVLLVDDTSRCGTGGQRGWYKSRWNPCGAE